MFYLEIKNSASDICCSDDELVKYLQHLHSLHQIKCFFKKGEFNTKIVIELY